ncbi:hypothetical protein RRG08_007077 [Elysia crispata]|uniref:Uncharacterized protein n=1 Tax=Elysia crispata TaxID=231223 RepID=A0AAE0YPN3_9GAST|nr:hypothetical protein RRG08_007077 [Elysia crispata]
MYSHAIRASWRLACWEFYLRDVLSYPSDGFHRPIRSSRWTKFDSVVILLAGSIGPSGQAVGPNSTRFSSYSQAPSVHQVEPLDQIRLGSHPTRRLHRSIRSSRWTKFDSVVILLAGSIGPSGRAVGPNSTRLSSYSRAPSVHQVERLDQIRLGLFSVVILFGSDGHLRSIHHTIDI